MTTKYKPKIPDYLKYMADDSLINSRDFAEIMGYKSVNCLYDSVSKGRLPKPDFMKPGIGIRGKKQMWKKSTIVKFLKESCDE